VNFRPRAAAGWRVGHDCCDEIGAGHLHHAHGGDAVVGLVGLQVTAFRSSAQANT
jgi:hypothetical protein